MLPLVITILLLPSLPTKCFISGTRQLTLEQHGSWCHQPIWTQLRSCSSHHTVPSSSVSPPGIQPTPDRVELLYLLLKRIDAHVDLLNSDPCSIVVSFRIKKNNSFHTSAEIFHLSFMTNLFSSTLFTIVIKDVLKSLFATVNIWVMSRSVSVDYFFSWVWVTFSCFFGCLIILDYILDIGSVVL